MSRMTSSQALCCLLSVKKQKHDFQLLDSIFVISRMFSLRLRLITPTSTSIIMDITKTSSNNRLLFTLMFELYTSVWFSQISYREFQFHLIFLPEFSVERPAFRKFNNFGFSGNFAGKFPYHLYLFRSFRSFCGLGEHCAGNVMIVGSNPVQSWKFFRVFFSSSVIAAFACIILSEWKVSHIS